MQNAECKIARDHFAFCILHSAFSSRGGAMALILVGINHRTAPVDVRERLNVPDAKLPECIASLIEIGSIDGACVISTCNRVEAIVSSPTEEVIESLVNWMAARAMTTRESIEKYLYILRHGDVVKHLFRVASGLDSMVVGEPQIAGQVKSAFMHATLDPLLNQLFEQTMRVAKRIRTETGIGEHAVSVPYADLELVADSNRDQRHKKAIEAEEIVAREVDAFRKRLVAQDAVPTIVELQQRLEDIRAAELEKCLRRLGPISAEQRGAIEQLTTQMVNKILHYPILQLKESTEEPHEREFLRRTIRKIFGLR